MAAARMMIWFHIQKNLHSDDYVLLFACLSLTASQVLFYILKLDSIYWLTAVLFEFSLQKTSSPALVVISEEDDHDEAVYCRILKSQRIHYSIGILTWTHIFTIKICFLLYFHQIITSLRRLIVAWRIILAIIIIFWALCSCTVFISCSHFGQATCKFILPSFTQFMLLIIDQKHLIKA